MSNYEHRSVLLREVLDAARPALRARADAAGSGPLVVDGTLGGGGHSAALLEMEPSARLIGVDRDPAALRAGTERLAPFGERATVTHGSYADLGELHPTLTTPEGGADVILVDLGVSSHQLDTADRGFSFRLDGPLDMRFDPGADQTALELLQEMERDELAFVLRAYGELRRPGRMAGALLRAVADGATTTLELARAAETVAGRPRPGQIHPATLVFQALRIHVNDEMGTLRRFLAAAPSWLRPGGRLLAISFHSLEDRLAKKAIRYWERGPAHKLRGVPAPIWDPILRPVGKVMSGQPDEVEDNPRARSAKLRVAERTETPLAPDAVARTERALEGTYRGR